jgi:preprotein translocase subunit SecY
MDSGGVGVSVSMYSVGSGVSGEEDFSGTKNERDRILRKKVLFVLGALLLFRILAAVPIPGVDTYALQAFFNNNQFFGLLDIFSGGGLSSLSIVMLGVGPYITASIIMQLMTIISPRLKELFQESGAAGRKKFSNYSRLLTVPLAVIQAFGFLLLLQQQGIISGLGGVALVTNILVVTAGSMLLMWIGELITEFGIGNGVSLIIFAGIVAGLPTALNQILFTYNPAQIPTYIAFVVIALITIIGVVFITEAERPIPVTYAKQVRSQGRTTGGASTYLPLRLNQAGVIPIIFALSILLLPQMIITFLQTVDNQSVQDFVSSANNLLTNQLVYGIAYFVLVFLFTYFYTAVTFDPESVSKNLQRSGGFVPGVRPGEHTNDYISNILSRITFFGASFLGLIAILPLVVSAVLPNITSLTVGGTALLIAVSVIIDLLKKVDGQVSLREY